MKNKDWREVQRMVAWYVLTATTEDELEEHLDRVLKLLMEAKIEKNDLEKKGKWN